jgi:apolipoprotein N-acyltransferase
LNASQIKQNVLAILPFAVTALLLSVIQPPVGWSVLAWVSMVPLVMACHPQIQARRLILTSYVIAIIYWLGNLYWVAPVTIVGWLVFCAYIALLWPILASAIRFCRAKNVPLFIAAPILIVGTERMQGLFLGGFFWRFLGHSQYENITIIQIADIFGAGGVSFVVAMVNGLIADWVTTVAPMKWTWSTPLLGPPRAATRSPYAPLGSQTAVVVCVLVAAAVYGRWRINQTEQFITTGPLAASLQSNIPQSVKRTFESSDELFAGLMEHSRTAVQAGARLIVWPETMVQATLNPNVLRILSDGHPYAAFDKALREHAKDNAYVLVGAYGGVPAVDRDGKPYLTMKYNSAFLYTPAGEQFAASYNKIHLVPFGEVLPLRRTVPWFYDALTKIKFIPYDYDYSLDYGSDYTVFEMADDQAQQTEACRFSAIICYEDVVPGLVRRFTLDDRGQKRIDWLVNISNDGWFVRFDDKTGGVFPSAELAQHAAICVFRAVENRLAILRGVNTGISCLIDSLGNIRDDFVAGTLPEKAMARTGMAGWFADRIPIDSRVTFFSKHGEWLDFCCEGCVFAFIIWALGGGIAKIRTKRVHLSGRSNERHVPTA